LKREKNPKVYLYIGIVMISLMFILISYVAYAMLSYGADNPKITDVLTLNVLLKCSEYLTSPTFELPLDGAVIADIMRLHGKLWWVYCLIPLIMFLMATSGSGNEYRGVEKGSASWATKTTERKFKDYTGIPMGHNFYATVNNPNKKEIGENFNKKPSPEKLAKITEKKLQGKLHGSFFEPHNLNEIVIGGSGMGKTFRKILVDLMQRVGSYVVTDPKGELYRNTCKMFIESGYDVKVLNLQDLECSNCYNPFEYITSEDDILNIADLFIKNASGEHSQEDYWKLSAKDLLVVVMRYLWRSKAETKTFGRVAELINGIGYADDKIDPQCELALCMQQHKIENPLCGANIKWQGFLTLPQVTMGGIVGNLSTALGHWTIKSVVDMTSSDEMDFDTIGVKKTVIFLIIPPARNPYKVIANIFYCQLFERLMYVANTKYSGRLPLLVSCELDEFANIGQIPNFNETLAVVRSHNIRICIVLQALSQLKALYEKTWSSIFANCSLFTYLGTTDTETIKYVVEKLGKTTVRSENKSWSQSNTGGSTSKNEHYDSRDLVSLEELPQVILKNSGKKYGGSCILWVDENKPFFLPKYATLQHPLISKVGSSKDGSNPNNTNIHDSFKDRPQPSPQPKPDIRKLAEMHEQAEQERLQNDFENGEDVDLG
jgi:type IV secretion system protein VirD4